MPRQNKSKSGEQDGNLRPERFMALVTFRQIRYFIAVAESGKISAAASMLGVEGANDALARPDSEMEGTLKLATTITVAGYFLAPLLWRFQRTFPNIEVQIV